MENYLAEDIRWPQGQSGSNGFSSSLPSSPPPPPLPSSSGRGKKIFFSIVVITVLGVIFFVVYGKLQKSKEIMEVTEDMDIPMSDIMSGLVAHWMFDGDSEIMAIDSSGSGNDGVIVGASRVKGLLGGALEFNGADDYVEVGTVGVSVEEGTVAVWVFAHDYGDNQVIFAHTTLPPFENRIQLIIDEAFGDLDIGVGDTRRANIARLKTDQWHHLAITWDGSMTVVYVDAERIFEDEYQGFNVVGDVAYIGNVMDPEVHDFGKISAWDGLIDDVRVYNRVLAPDDVGLLYNIGEQGNEL